MSLIIYVYVINNINIYVINNIYIRINNVIAFISAILLQVVVRVIMTFVDNSANINCQILYHVHIHKKVY